MIYRTKLILRPTQLEHKWTIFNTSLNKDFTFFTCIKYKDIRANVTYNLSESKTSITCMEKNNNLGQGCIVSNDSRCVLAVAFHT